MGTWFGRFFLLGYTWTLFHHTFGGIRHLQRLGGFLGVVTLQPHFQGDLLLVLVECDPGRDGGRSRDRGRLVVRDARP